MLYHTLGTNKHIDLAWPNRIHDLGISGRKIFAHGSSPNPEITNIVAAVIRKAIYAVAKAILLQEIIEELGPPTDPDASPQ